MPPIRGSKRPAEARLPPCSSRSSPTPSTSSPRSAATSGESAREWSSRDAGSPCTQALVDGTQRHGFTYVDDAGERTITTIGRKLHPRGHDDALPWHELARCDAVYFCAGDADALLLARRGRVVVATARELPTLRQAAVELDALVSSGKDEAERYQPGQLDPEPRLVVTTSGALGGWAQPGGPYSAAELPPDPADAYGAGTASRPGSRSRWPRASRGSTPSTSQRAAAPGRWPGRACTPRRFPLDSRRALCASWRRIVAFTVPGTVETLWGAGVAKWGKVE